MQWARIIRPRILWWPDDAKCPSWNVFFCIFEYGTKWSNNFISCEALYELILSITGTRHVKVADPLPDTQWGLIREPYWSELRTRREGGCQAGRGREVHLYSMTRWTVQCVSFADDTHFDILHTFFKYTFLLHFVPAIFWCSRCIDHDAFKLQCLWL